jgi:integrase/recombinase XerD
MHWKSAKKEFSSHLQFERGLSRNTVQAYVRDLDLLIGFAEERELKVLGVRLQDLEACIKSQLDAGKSHRSVARMISSWKAFYLYLILEGLLSEDPTALLEAPKLGAYLPEVMSIDEIDRMMACIELGKPSGHRDRAIIETLYGCGLRVSELTGLEMNHLHPDERYIQVTGKGNKQRLVPIHEEALKHLMLYLSECRSQLKVKTDSKHLVFLNLRGGSLSRVSVFQLVKKLAESAGISKNVSPHTFRHSFATHLVQNGADLRVVQELLGHESILTTEIYTHLDRKHLAAVVKKYHPRNQD